MDPISLIRRILPAIVSQIGDEQDGGSSPAPSFGSAPSGGSAPTSGGKGGGSFDPGPNKELAEHKGSIDKAASISGLDPNLIGAQVWAESRGDKGTKSTNKGDGHTDTGLMQISQERWENEIAPDLDPAERQKIVEQTGKQPEELDMNDPEEGIIGGSLEMKSKIDECHGDVESALGYYQSGKKGSNIYSKNVMQYMEELQNGEKLSEDPFGSP